MLDFFIKNLFFKIMKSHLIAILIFKIKFNPIQDGTYYFDMTTYVLTKLLLKNLNNKHSVLDMGTGSCCVIGLTLWKHLKCNIISSDINPDILSSAQENIDLNCAKIKLVHSNLFENIQDDFDVITFNPPYVPTNEGNRSKLSEKFKSQWDGGLDGTLIVDKFLNEFNELKKSIIAYVGINSKYVSKEIILTLINSKNNLELKKIHEHRFLPIQIYVIKKYIK